jgi:hypothetical protein
MTAEATPHADTPITVQTPSIENIEAVIRQSHGMDGRHIVLKTLMEISREIPDNVNALTPPMAEHLAARFLKGLDLCGELYALAVSYELKMEVLKKRDFSNAMLVRSANVPGLKTAKEKEMYAFSDELYLQAADKYVEGKMFRLFVEEKKEAFSKAHYMVRKIVDRDQIAPTMIATKAEEEVEWTQTTKWG